MSRQGGNTSTEIITTYQKLRKLAAISGSDSSARFLLRLTPREWPEPSLEMDRLAPDVPLRWRVGREDLDLEA